MTTSAYGELGQHVAQLFQAFGDDPIPHPRAPSISLDEPGLVENLEVVADGWLRLADRFDEVARADLAFGCDEREDAQPHGVTESRECGGELLGVAFFQRRVENRRAADRNGTCPTLRRGHREMVPDIEHPLY
jgi:hypothetical protein